MFRKTFCALAILLCLFIVNWAQKSALQACNLPLDRAPKLREFYLGQTYEDIAKRIPGFQDDYNNAVSGTFRAPNADFRIISSSTLATDINDLEDVSITWHFYKGRVIAIFSTYSAFVPRNLRDFIEQVETTTGLPKNELKVTGRHKARMVCGGFSVELWYGQESKVGWDPGFSTIVIEDLAGQAAYDAEVEAFLRAQKKAELQKKEEERRKRTTLKP